MKKGLSVSVEGARLQQTDQVKSREAFTAHLARIEYEPRV